MITADISMWYKWNTCTNKTYTNQTTLGTDHLTWRGGLWFFASFRNFFSDNTRVRLFIFFVALSAIFFSEFNIRLYDKNSESDYFFFPPPKSEYFFQQHWESEYFFRKNHNPPFQVKWSFPKYIVHLYLISYYIAILYH